MTDIDERRIVAAYPALRRFAFVVADSDTDPDDLLHEALVRVLGRRDLGDIHDLGAYIRRAITNVASNTRRSLGRKRRAMVRLASEAGTDAVEAERPSDLAELMSLDPGSRAAVYLFAVEGRSHREIADVLDVSEQASRARVSRALRLLRVEDPSGVISDHTG
ncbi:MAG: sigma-70 family RNA polymerase sigma factor [Acidimicrobiales bacterium]|nr:sigma-70 family RNA polymerase sigma factor [Acidimicrobiales bacterium]